MRNWDCCPKGHVNKLTGATLHNSPTNKPIGVANKLVGRTIVDGHKKKDYWAHWEKKFCPPCFVLFCFLSYSHLAVYILHTLQMSRYVKVQEVSKCEIPAIYLNTHSAP